MKSIPSQSKAGIFPSSVHQNFVGQSEVDVGELPIPECNIAGFFFNHLYPCYLNRRIDSQSKFLLFDAVAVGDSISADPIRLSAYLCAVRLQTRAETSANAVSPSSPAPSSSNAFQSKIPLNILLNSAAQDLKIVLRTFILSSLHVVLKVAKTLDPSESPAVLARKAVPIDTIVLSSPHHETSTNSAPARAWQIFLVSICNLSLLDELHSSSSFIVTKPIRRRRTNWLIREFASNSAELSDHSSLAEYSNVLQGVADVTPGSHYRPLSKDNSSISIKFPRPNRRNSSEKYEVSLCFLEIYVPRS
jgi:hypothetical protein